MFLQGEKAFSHIDMLSDWSVNSQEIILVEFIEIVAQFSSLEFALWSVELDQDVAIPLLFSEAYWGVWSFDFSSNFISSAENES
jgi:hypothetical protein